MRSFRTRITRWSLTIATAGALFQLGGCSLGGAASFLRDFNPCGSVIDCSAIGGPAGYRFLTSGYEGPGVDADIDPACTYPPFCTGDPFAPVGVTP
jgi:hypothetical protein